MINEAIDAAFEEHGEPAVYLKSGHDPLAITILREAIAPTIDQNFMNVGLVRTPERQTTAFTALVRQSEVELPGQGDQLTTNDGRCYPVAGVPTFDGFGIWRLPLGVPQ